MATVSTQDLRTIVTDPNGAETLVSNADQLGKDLKGQGLTTSQIRALFGEVRQIQGQWTIDNDTQRQLARRRMILLKPKMAYRARKERGRAVEELVKVLDPALDLVIREDDPSDPSKQQAAFNRFVEFFEAILAYHKSYGGN